jgi:hypothetical protein
VTRRKLSPEEIFQVCLGQFSLGTYRGESPRAFSFGGLLAAKLEQENPNCGLTSNAPIFKLRDDPGAVGGVIADELMDWL